MAQDSGLLIFHLHAHLPYVRHPEYESFMEEDWLFEAITETYIPLLTMMERLRNDGVKFKLSFTLSPPLCEMLTDNLLIERYTLRLEKLHELARKEITRTQADPNLSKCAKFNLSRLTEIKDYFHNCNRNIVGQFRSLFESGHIDILSCGATHGLLVHMNNPSAVRAQLRVAAENYKKHFGTPPRGIWLPECSYFEGLDRLLAQEGYEYTFLDAHGLLLANPCPENGIWSPIVSPQGVKFLARDVESSKQVWSSKEGYPGDVNYREFYRDLGYDADEEYIKPYLHDCGTRHNLGLKYHRITGEVDLSQKLPYDPTAAMLTAEEHAGNFHFNRTQQFKYLHEKVEGAPVVLAPYDAELFGHWWFEGPWFIEKFLRISSNHNAGFQTSSARDAVAKSKLIPAVPSPSSWGAGGYYSVWLNETNQWMYPHLHEAEERMISIAQFTDKTEIQTRIEKQLARELLLAQSSDWAFITTTATTVPYAVKRFKEHIHFFTRLYEMFHSPSPDVSFLEKVEGLHPIFEEIDSSVYAQD